MAARGRPKRSQVIPFSGDTAPSELIGAPSCPKELDEVAKKKWHETVKFMAALGTLNKSLKDRIADYCAAFSRRHKAEVVIARDGEILRSARGGLYRSPWLDVSNHAFKQMTTLSKMLGLDAMTQKRLNVKATMGTERKVSVRDRYEDLDDTGS